MSPSPNALLALLAPLALTACGFAPLYGDRGTDAAGNPLGPVTAQMQQVDIQNIPERTGQLLRNALQDQFYTAGAPTKQRYSLAVTYSITAVGIGVQPDTSVTRNRYIATANWALAPIGSPTTPYATGLANTQDAENIIDQQYFALTLETDTVDRELANNIAAQIATQVATWFKNHPAA